MDNVKINIYGPNRFPVDRRGIRQAVKELFEQYRLDDQPSLVEVTIVGGRKIRELNRAYRKIDEPTDVLAFPLQNLEPSPDGKLRYGDVVINYAAAKDTAILWNRLIDKVIVDLIVHGVKHLVGDHHE